MIIRVNNENKSKDLHILEFGTPPPNTNTGRSWGPGVRESYVLHVIFSGEGTFNGKTLKAGQYFLLKPYQKVNYFPNVNNPWDYFWIAFSGDQADKFLSSYDINPIKTFGQFNRIEDVKQTIDSFFSKEFFTIDEETALNFARFILSFNKNKKKVLKGTRKQKHILTATEHIQNKYHKPITPSSVADFIGVSRKYLYFLFKQFLGISIQDYIINLRIEKAKILLEKSDLNISEIGYSVGIENPLDFSRTFKKKVGISPKAYRKQIKG